MTQIRLGIRLVLVRLKLEKVCQYGSQLPTNLEVQLLMLRTVC